MRVKTWVEIEQEVDVEVSIAEVMSAISELAESDRLPMLLDCINSVHSVLKNIPDERIASMNEKQRDIICRALRAQASRYMEPLPK